METIRRSTCARPSPRSTFARSGSGAPTDARQVSRRFLSIRASGSSARSARAASPEAPTVVREQRYAKDGSRRRPLLSRVKASARRLEIRKVGPGHCAKPSSTQRKIQVRPADAVTSPHGMNNGG